MNKQKSFNTVFFLRDKKDMLQFYKRVDFWVALLSLVLVVLSLTLARYASNGGGTTFSQMWRLTAGNWALILCGLFSIIGMVYVFVTSLLFRNSAVLSGINIGVGLLMAILFMVEYFVLKTGYNNGNGEILAMSNSAGIGFYFGIIGAIIVVGLEFYKLGSQGYYTAEDFAKEKSQNGVEVVDGVVIIDGEKVEVKDDTKVNENKTNVRVITEKEENNEDKKD